MWIVDLYKAMVLQQEQWHLQKWGESDAPAVTTSIAYGLLSFVNVFSCLLLVKLLTGWFPARVDGALRVVLIAIPFLGFSLLHYGLFFRESIYRRNVVWLNRRMDKDPHLLGLAVAYYLSSIGLFFVLSSLNNWTG